MKKKIVSILLLFSILGSISGCNKAPELMLPYEEKSGGIIYNSADNINPSRTELFSSDLCLVSLGADKDKDGNLTGLGNMLVDITDKKVIYANNIYEKLYPASITKIVTALVVLKYGNLKDTVTVSHAAANITESGAKKCGFKEGDKINLKALLYCFLIYSGNDAGIALAEHISGSEEEFAKIMTKEAKALGATQSNFVNSHGLHNDNHYTTIYDIYLIFQEMIQNETFLDIIKKDSYSVEYKNKNGKTVKPSSPFLSTNRYLTGKAEIPDGITVIGGKTGTTSKAGSCLILYSQDEQKHDYLSFIFKAENSNASFSQMSYLLKLVKR